MASRTVFRFLVLLAALVWILAAENKTRGRREPGNNGSWFNMGLIEFESWSNQPGLFTERSRLCARIRGLTPGQRRICRRYQDHMPAVGAGAKQGIAECQYQFKDRRWNCTTTGDETVFGPLTLIASRETAFTHAITAAGASLHIARACRDGRLTSCGCSRSHRPKNLHSDWVWAGCGMDLEYGYRSLGMTCIQYSLALVGELPELLHSDSDPGEQHQLDANR